MPDEIEMPHEALERHEHAVHAEHGDEHKSKGGRITLLILVLAMSAAVAGKVASETEVKYLKYEIERSDTWAQYQGKSDRAAMAMDLAKLAAVMPNAADPAVQKAINDFTATAARLDSDPNGEGKQQLAEKAKELERRRDEEARRMEGFSVTVVLMAIAIGLGSASMLSRADMPRKVLAGVSALAGAGAAAYGLIVASGAM